MESLYPSGQHGQTTITATTPIIDIVNVVVGTAIAGLMTHHWNLADRDRTMGNWMKAAWLFTAADILFALRPRLPPLAGWFDRALFITASQVILLTGARLTGGKETGYRVTAGLVAAHAGLLGILLVAGGAGTPRLVLDGLIESGLSLASFLALRRAADGTRGHFGLPAALFLTHGVLHTLRVSTAVYSSVTAGAAVAPWLRIYDDLEDVLFLTPLLVSLLTAQLRLRNEELTRALAEVRVLSGLLPIC